MKTDTTKDVWVDVSGLPRDNRDTIIWEKCIGLKVPFKCYEIRGNILVINYNKINRQVSIKYNNQQEYTIHTSTFLKCGFIRYVTGRKKTNWAYNIGDHIVDNKRDLIVTDRSEEKKYKDNKYHRYYKYRCNICGFDCASHYKSGNLVKELWTPERSLKNFGCTCCKNRIAVKGINDIPTTDPWMINFFQGGYDEASKYTAQSGVKIYPVCPDCGRIKDKLMAIQTIYKMHGIGCKCSDGRSYPNKFSYAFLEQLPINNWVTEYQPDWAKPYQYDNYFEYKNKKYILEMDGALGHGCIEYKTGNKDVIGKQIDNLKDFMAIKHNIKVIRVDCKKSKCSYIKNNILASELFCIFNLSNIDWNKCDEYALKNIVKEVCLFWEKNNHIDYKFIKEKFKIKKDDTIRSYLSSGTEHGWCNYSDTYHIDKSKKKVNIYNTNYKYLGTFDSLTSLANKSEKLFGVKFTVSGISGVCARKHKTHAGHIFRHTDDDELYELNNKQINNNDEEVA